MAIILRFTCWDPRPPLGPLAHTCCHGSHVSGQGVPCLPPVWPPMAAAIFSPMLPGTVQKIFAYRLRANGHESFQPTTTVGLLVARAIMGCGLFYTYYSVHLSLLYGAVLQFAVTRSFKGSKLEENASKTPENTHQWKPSPILLSSGSSVTMPRCPVSISPRFPSV